MLTHEKIQLKSRTLDSNGSHKNQTLSFVDNRGNIAQRYVSVTSNKKDSGDFITFNSIAFGHKVAGGTIENFNASDFSGLKSNEGIAFVGHGKVGISGDYTGEAIAEKLLDSKEGMPEDKSPHHIVFTSCHAGVSEENSSDSSVVDIVQNAIREKHPTTNVRGAMGASVKTISNGKEEWGVIDSTHKEVAGTVQELLEEYFKIEKKPLFDTTSPTIEDKAIKTQKKCHPFFETFIYIINGEYDKVDAEILTKIEKKLDIEELTIKKKYPNGLKAVSPMKILQGKSP